MDVFTKLKDNINIVELVEKYNIPLKKKGTSQWACCPFHTEKTPSFSVSSSKQLFNCFGCGEKGDIFAFVQKKENITLSESVTKLSSLFGIDISEFSNEKITERKVNLQPLYNLMTAVAEYFNNNLSNEALAYLQENRCLNINQINSYKIGLAPSQKDFFAYIKQQGFSKDDLIKCDIIASSENGDEYFRFAHRLIIPIHNQVGNIIAFGGRKFTGCDEKSAKYINSRETILYNKSSVLFGYNIAKQAMNSENKAFILEGYFDVITAQINGIKNVVAACGTSITKEQIKVIKKQTNNIYLVGDGDDAGNKSNIRAIDVVLDANAIPNIVQLPSGHDPDTFIKEYGKDSFIDVINKSDNFIDYYKKIYTTANLNAKIEVLKKVKNSINLVTDQEISIVLVNYYEKVFANQLVVKAPINNTIITDGEDIDSKEDKYIIEIKRLYKTYSKRIVDGKNIGDYIKSELHEIKINFEDQEDEVVSIDSSKYLTLLKSECFEMDKTFIEDIVHLVVIIKINYISAKIDELINDYKLDNLQLLTTLIEKKQELSQWLKMVRQ